MKNKLTLLLVSCLLVSGISLPGNGQTGAPTAVNAATERVNRCLREVMEAKAHIADLKRLIKIYPPDPRVYTIDGLSFTQHNTFTKSLEYWEQIYSIECGNLEDSLGAYDNAVADSKRPPTPTPTPTPTPEPYTGPPIIPVDPNSAPPSEDDLKKLKDFWDKIGPLSAEIFDWVKKHKAKLPPAKPIDESKTKIEWQPGVQMITVDMPNDVVRINLPDELRASDSLSGTVYVEPKVKQPGNNETRKDDGLTIEFIRTYPDGTSSYYIVPSGSVRSGTLGAVIRSYVPGKFATGSPSSGVVTGYDSGTAAGDIKCEIEITDANGNRVKLTPRIQNSDTTDPTETKLPNLGQTGRAISFPGNFDGNSSNTQVTIDGKPVEILAESPRKCVFRSSVNITGAVPIEVNENGRVTRGTFRNVGLGLSAPNTNLKRGEKTTLTVQVTGLAGIRSDVPLQLVKTGTVTMGGGDTQHIRIRPQDVRADGTYSLTREITGVLPGGFNVTATVFDPTRRPIVIPLTQGSRVNGYEVTMENGKPVLVAGGVIDPLTGKPLDGTHRLQAGCGNPVLSKIPYLSRLFKNGDAKFDKADCLVFITPRIIVE